MTSAPPQHRQRQLLLALLLFLLGQFALALHSHDPSLHPVDADECVVCLVTSSDNPGPISETPGLHFTAENTQHLPARGVLASQPQHTPSQPRAPPLS